MENLLMNAQEAVKVKSSSIPHDALKVEGYDFNNGCNLSDMLTKYYLSTGFQATALGEAIKLVNEMISNDHQTIPENENEDENSPLDDPNVRQNTKCKIFLGYTSNMASSGIRDIIRFLVQHKMVDVVVSTAGGIEEDFIKCLAPTHILGTFNADGAALRSSGMNRIGNLVIANENYCLFEDWLMPILDQMVTEQSEKGTLWTPSRMINRLGMEINDESSIYYWCWKNDIPVYCPAITDGSMGDMIFFHSYKSPGLVIDLVEDIRGINSAAMKAKKTGMIVLGGGLVKHHIFNANLMRNGADYAVLINTGHEFDGSDSGASIEEAVSWGKVRANAKRVKISADATLIFPLLVAETFAKKFHNSIYANKLKQDTKESSYTEDEDAMLGK